MTWFEVGKKVRMLQVVTHFSDLVALSGKAAASASGELSIKKERPTNALVPSMEITKSSPLVGGNAGK